MMFFIKALLGFSFISCSNQGSTNNYLELQPINEISLSIKEPSGISFGRDYQSYWVVSDGDNGRIYNLALDGTVINELNYAGNDLEGISYDHDENVLWVVEERRRDVLKLSLRGNILLRQPISIQSTSKHGLEGIAVINSGEVWISHEKSPRLLLKISANSSESDQYALDEAKDYSGLCYSSSDSSLWIVSDESELLIKWDIATGQVEKYALPIPKAEGICINPQDNTLHIVSDKTARIYIFNIPE